MTLLITFKNGQQDLLAGVQVDISKALDIAYRGNDLLRQSIAEIKAINGLFNIEGITAVFENSTIVKDK